MQEEKEGEDNYIHSIYIQGNVYQGQPISPLFPPPLSSSLVEDSASEPIVTGTVKNSTSRS